jgi:hypothetical protein
MNIMTMKASRALRAVDKAKARTDREKNEYAGRLLREAIQAATPWDINLRHGRTPMKNFFKLVFAAWIAGILVAIVVMAADRFANSDAPAKAHTVEFPL